MGMKIVGRSTEQELLRDCLFSGRPEFLAVYGRRRVGKTFLIKEYFENSFSFYATGVPNQKTAQQLKYFHQSLLQYGCPEKKAPGDWLEAFSRLRKLLERDDAQKDPVSGKLVVFLDELPWMDTARSDFKGALDYFLEQLGVFQRRSAVDRLWLRHIMDHQTHSCRYGRTVQQGDPDNASAAVHTS